MNNNKHTYSKTYSKELMEIFSELEDKFKIIEKQRIKSNNIIIIFKIISILAIIFLIFQIWTKILINIFFTLFFVASILIMGNLISSCEISLFYNKTKNIIFKSILNYFGNFLYEENNKNNSLFLHNYINNLTLLKNELFNHIDDRFNGMYNDIFLEIAEIRSESSSRGIFIKAPSFKEFKGITIISKKGKSKFEKYRVNLESVEFEQKYNVYSTDQIEARYLITTAFMERLLELSHQRFLNEIILSFENQSVNIFFSTNKDWFDIPINQSFKNINPIRELVQQLYIIFNLIDTLKIEQNIGM